MKQQERTHHHGVSPKSTTKQHILNNKDKHAREIEFVIRGDRALFFSSVYCECPESFGAHVLEGSFQQLVRGRVRSQLHGRRAVPHVLGEGPRLAPTNKHLGHPENAGLHFIRQVVQFSIGHPGGACN